MAHRVDLLSMSWQPGQMSLQVLVTLPLIQLPANASGKVMEAGTSDWAPCHLRGRPGCILASDSA